MDRLVLKVGNLLEIVYQLSARASVDVDLSMSGEFEDVDKLRAKRPECARISVPESTGTSCSTSN